ncbi:MAG TPA: tetratricopeptide repeat protein [Terracidiphilus sp.]|nr:tetratricopeptide repeat protein [Terracidiphilus sp.]
MRKLWLCTLLMGSLFPRGAAAAEKPWIEVSSPHFTVETDAGERQARQLLEQFERMRWVFRTLYPKIHADPPEPILVVAVRNEKEFQGYVPAGYLGRGKLKLAGYFQPGADKNSILLRLDTEDRHPYATIYHEYTHFQFRSIEMWMPIWLNEGIAEFFQNTVVEPKYVQLGMPSADDILYLRQQNLIPLDVLFRVDRSSPYYHEEDKGSVFYAESWALTHYLEVQDRKDGRNRLITYLTLVLHRKDPVEAATEAFGNLHALTNTLAAYIRNGNYMQFQMNTASSPIDVSAYPVKQLTLTDVEATRANVLMDVRRTDEAKALIQQVLAQDPKNVQAHETMGLVALRSGNRDEAQKWLGEAVALGAQGFEVNMLYAGLLMSSPKADEAQIESCLHAAIRANPRDARVHEMLASREAMEHVRLDDALKQSEEAVSLDPGRVEYREMAASVLEQQRKLPDAQNMLHSAMLVARTPEEKQFVQERVTELQQMEELESERVQTAALSPAANGVIDVPAAYVNGPDAGTATTTVVVPGENGPGGSAPATSAPGVATLPPDVPRHPDAANGPKHTATGVIRQVHCSYPVGIEFELVERKKTLKVYNNHFNELNLTVSGFTPRGSMNPCRDFEGMKARISYAESADKTVDGKVFSIVLMK